MRFEVIIDTKAAREISALPREVQQRIIARIESLADNPRPPGCIKLSGASSLWRIRCGVYRVVYQISDDRLEVTVVTARHRKDAYR